MKKEITKKGYRTLAVTWTLAAAAMAVAFVRRIAEFNLPLLLLLVLSTLIASGFWKSYHATPEQESVAPDFDPFDDPPSFRDDPELFDDAPPPIGSQLFADDAPSPARRPNQDSEEKDHE